MKKITEWSYQIVKSTVCYSPNHVNALRTFFLLIIKQVFFIFILWHTPIQVSKGCHANDINCSFACAFWTLHCL